MGNDKSLSSRGEKRPYSFPHYYSLSQALKQFMKNGFLIHSIKSQHLNFLFLCKSLFDPDKMTIEQGFKKLLWHFSKNFNLFKVIGLITSLGRNTGLKLVEQVFAIYELKSIKLFQCRLDCINFGTIFKLFLVFYLADLPTGKFESRINKIEF